MKFKSLLQSALKGSLNALGFVVPQGWAAILGGQLVAYLLERLADNLKSSITKEHAESVKSAVKTPVKKN